MDVRLSVASRRQDLSQGQVAKEMKGIVDRKRGKGTAWCVRETQQPVMRPHDGESRRLS